MEEKKLDSIYAIKLFTRFWFNLRLYFYKYNILYYFHVYCASFLIFTPIFTPIFSIPNGLK